MSGSDKEKAFSITAIRVKGLRSVLHPIDGSSRVASIRGRYLIGSLLTLSAIDETKNEQAPLHPELLQANMASGLILSSQSKDAAKRLQKPKTKTTPSLSRFDLKFALCTNHTDGSRAGTAHALRQATGSNLPKTDRNVLDAKNSYPPAEIVAAALGTSVDGANYWSDLAPLVADPLHHPFKELLNVAAENFGSTIAHLFPQNSIPKEWDSHQQWFSYLEKMADLSIVRIDACGTQALLLRQCDGSRESLTHHSKLISLWYKSTAPTIVQEFQQAGLNIVLLHSASDDMVLLGSNEALSSVIQQLIQSASDSMGLGLKFYASAYRREYSPAKMSNRSLYAPKVNIH